MKLYLTVNYDGDLTPLHLYEKLEDAEKFQEAFPDVSIWEFDTSDPIPPLPDPNTVLVYMEFTKDLERIKIDILDKQPDNPRYTPMSFVRMDYSKVDFYFSVHMEVLKDLELEEMEEEGRKLLIEDKTELLSDLKIKLKAYSTHPRFTKFNDYLNWSPSW